MVEEKILVVDDSAEVQQQVNEMLSQVGSKTIKEAAKLVEDMFS